MHPKERSVIYSSQKDVFVPIYEYNTLLYETNLHVQNYVDPNLWLHCFYASKLMECTVWLMITSE
jgi:hypothetical protein